MEYLSQDSLTSAGEGPSLSTFILKPTPNDETSRWRFMNKFGSPQGSSKVSLFSSSLPVLPHEKFFTDSGINARSIDDISKLDDLQNHLDVKDSIEVFDLRGIGSLLPDEDELFDSIMSGYTQTELSNLEQVEDCEIFSSGGGIELDTDPLGNVTFSMERENITESYIGNDNFQCSSNGVGSVGGEHPYGEHPSRTLFVRNINSNVEDAELRSLFEQYGDIRSMYTHCKHRGFVMISYYDIRHARNAMRALQNKPLRRRKLDIHFSIPKDNPSDKDLNQGTLVVFNLDPSVSNDVLRQIFGAFGEVKEIRETPNKKHHKFVEFYDVRAAEDALRSLNKSDIAGKRIKLEPSRPGGARRNFMHQLNQDIDSDEINSYKHQVGSPLTSSPPGAWVQFSGSVDNTPLSASISPLLCTGSPVSNGHSPELTSVLHSLISNPSKISTVSKEHFRINQAEPLLSSNSPMQGPPFLQSHLFPEQGGGMMPNLRSSSVSTASFAPLNSRTSRMETLTGPQFLWGSPKSHSEHQSSVLSMSSLGNAFTSDGQRHSFARSYLSNHGSLLAASRHHVGSAPSSIPFEKRPGFLYDLPDSSFVNPASVWSMGISQDANTIMTNSGLFRGPINQGSSFSGTSSASASSGFRMISSPRIEPVFVGNPSYTGHGSIGMEGLTDRGWIRQADKGKSLLDGKKLFQLDLEKIISGEDTRTTLMIKNIPNKYTCKMLLSSIDENHRGFYDFLYLPIDFKNKCNVGYAFINMVSPSHIVSFHQAFSGRRWEKFNSEKVASLAYARIQGKAALVAHFQNSSLMNEDKRCRPILFDSRISEASNQKSYQEDLPESLLVSKLQVNCSVPANGFAEE